MGNFIDLTGKVFGRLTVVKREKNKKTSVQWLCKCSCGKEAVVSGASLRNGYTKSCGCLRKEETAKRKFVDLTGMQFGKWTVLYRDGSSSNGHARWCCMCSCGKYGYVDSSSLLLGISSSCGCEQKIRVRNALLNDLTGKQFGKLHVIELVDNIYKKGTYWRCECECGNIIDVAAPTLINGTSKSCGCVLSYGEVLLKQILEKHNIRFERQKSFIKCVYKKPLHFDYWLPDYGVCVEFNGRQHYGVVDNWNDTEDAYAIRKERDNIKQKWCDENDIILINIPYWEKDNIEPILRDWLFLYDEITEGRGYHASNN